VRFWYIAGFFALLGVAMGFAKTFWPVPVYAPNSQYIPDPSTFNTLNPADVPLQGPIFAFVVARDLFYNIVFGVKDNCEMLMSLVGFPREYASTYSVFIASAIYLSYAVFIIQLLWGRVFER